ncbi:Uncharacterised protein [Salmonella enterica subsp. enterica serovar Bovismorbificans]|uniref:Uncharacterized protein n=1 Tax=Salmonella enterica subsp. enterica serovar Bovismorbificans TaxID=58097 RepID=A0A655DUG8_SALET|nr:Uncharacterised protein [Salmonella enterica subsp. enterica serovar Bovismorbificans]
MFPGEVGRHLTDRRRAMTTASATGRCHIKRYASDHPVGIAVIRLEVHWQT